MQKINTGNFMLNSKNASIKFLNVLLAHFLLYASYPAESANSLINESANTAILGITTIDQALELYSTPSKIIRARDQSRLTYVYLPSCTINTSTVGANAIELVFDGEGVLSEIQLICFLGLTQEFEIKRTKLD